RQGDSYLVNLSMVGDELDEKGFLVNFRELKEVVEGELDEDLLNEVPGFEGESGCTEIVVERV
ncbi:6-carboxytetrahydropterin synthase, partial [Staphylococcus pettenkoferi]|uniref:6-carboxytetrahydropterin synthase n=1 Tax=Staphylococcus pettenkoferi TaxID=170573 RepID=UPI0016429583